MAERAPIDHYTGLLAEPYHIGCRAWQVFNDGKLYPMVNRAGPWTPGVNRFACSRSACKEAPRRSCHCGLYAYQHPLDHQPYSYFDFDSGRVTSRSRGLIGGVAYWNPAQGEGFGAVVRSSHAVVACLVTPVDAGVQEREDAERAAEQYQVKLTTPSGIEKATHAFIKRQRKLLGIDIAHQLESPRISAVAL